MTVSDERADRLAEVACELIVRVRDDAPEAVNRWLTATLPNPDDRWGLIFVLAMAVPDDKSFVDLTKWARVAASHRAALLARRQAELDAAMTEREQEAA